MITVTGTQDETSYVLTKDDLPSELAADFLEAIREQRKVGLPWWRRVPSFDEDEGFVAGCLWWLDEVESVQGFDVPKPDPDVIY